MPGQIVVAVVAELRVYRFWGGEGRFPELLRILEKECEPFAVRHGSVVKMRVAFVAELARRIWLRGVVSAGRLGTWYGSVATLLPN